MMSGTAPLLTVMKVLAVGLALLAVAAKQAEAAFPGENGKIAFYKFVAGQHDNIFDANTNGSGLQQITSYKTTENSPAWSPNGKKLLFEKLFPNHDPGMRNTEIVLKNIQTGHTRRLTHNSVYDLAPAFSPDGTKLVFARNTSSGRAIYTMNLNGTGVHRLAEKPDVLFDNPAWSPDGSKIAFERNEKLWVMNADGTNKKKVTTEPSQGEEQPDWSPDGSEIAFVRHVVNKASEIYAIKPDGTGLRNITNTPKVYEGAPAYSPNGKRIAFTHFDTETNLNDIWTTRAADGSNPMQVTNTPNEEEFAPSWQPLP